VHYYYSSKRRLVPTKALLQRTNVSISQVVGTNPKNACCGELLRINQKQKLYSISDPIQERRTRVETKTDSLTQTFSAISSFFDLSLLKYLEEILKI
jgi:hypothetical protein